MSATDSPTGETRPVTRPYGLRGQAQSGIDVYARDRLVPGDVPPNRRYVSLQARRIKSVTKAKLSSAVDEFLGDRWADVSRQFIYATSSSAVSTKLADEIDTLSARLAGESIEFMVWDQEAISRRLKDLPQLVDDFFGRPWVEQFCGEAAAHDLGTRLDAKRVANLRHQLARTYAATFGVADSGQIAFHFSEAHPVGLLDRFVTPDIVSITPQAASLPHPTDGLSEESKDDHDPETMLSEAAAWKEMLPDESAWFLRSPAWGQRRVDNPQVLERRPADQWIGTESRQIIVGEPGVGKSTLLRFLVLDLLSENPRWRAVAQRWGQRLPIWLPFHFFTQRITSQTGAPASIGGALEAWLEQHDAGQAWPLVKAALNDERLLLIVDGLDEWVDPQSGQYAVAALETFAESHSAQLVVTTRPYGLAHLMLGASWAYSRIAPLTPEQQHQLALHYFRAVLDHGNQPSSLDVIERSVDDFFSRVGEAPDLRSISAAPLFLILLVGLHLSNVAQLPSGRFDVYEQAVQLLIASHPAKRRVAAAVTAPHQRLSDRQVRALLARIAFVTQVRGGVSAVPESALRQDLLQALRDPELLGMSAKDAMETADQMLDIAEGELGVLVRKGPQELGFLHRMLHEQLAAEHATDQLSLDALKELLDERIGDPEWREVLLATIWRLSRPDELRVMLDVIRKSIDQTPAGLRAREMLAEVTFGPYDIPPPEIQQSTPEIIEVIETHPYGPHRVRLLESVLSGLDSTASAGIVRECLERWVLLVEEPSPGLVWQIAQVTPAGNLSKTICKLLVRALHYPDARVAYESAVGIASRCSRGGLGDDSERALLRRKLLHILSEPPSGLAAAAALTALGLEWRDDPLVSSIFNEARGHKDEGVRVVALSDALGVLRPMFSDAPEAPKAEIRSIRDDERKWLIGRLQDRTFTDSHRGLLVAAISEVARGERSTLDDLLESLQDPTKGWHDVDLVWPVMLNVFADDERVVDLVCRELRSKKYPNLGFSWVMGDLQALASAYPPESPHNARVASAIEDRLRAFKGKTTDRALFGLSAVDRGPAMKEALLHQLTTSSWPHWAAEALAEHFAADADAQRALRSAFMGDPIRASMIANIATRVMAATEAVPRLLALLRELSGSSSPNSGRYDIIATALARACQEQEGDSGLDLESIAEEALALVPTGPWSPSDDPRYDLAASLYPSAASKSMLAELAGVVDRPLAPYLRAFRSEPDQVRPFLERAANIICSLPAHLRGQLCQALADRAVVPEVALQLTRRWSDEVSDRNKSIASLAHHRALLTAKEEEHIGSEEWQAALAHLGEQAVAYGPDFEARRRAAWIGMCVCGDWSMLEGCTETIGEPVPVGVSLADVLYGPDANLLQQLAFRWDALRSEFGESLLIRLSGTRATETQDSVWDALALVAGRNATLQQEIEGAVADNPGLLKRDGVLAWFVAYGRASRDAVADTVVSHLRHSDDRRGSVASQLLAEPERLGLPRDELCGRLESALQRAPFKVGDPALEALAVLFPEHPVVQGAWNDLSELIAARRGTTGYRVDPPIYFALAYAATESSAILEQIERNLDRLDEIGSPYYDYAFKRHVCNRLRRDSAAVSSIRDAVMDPATPDARAAVLASLLVAAVGLDDALRSEVERRLIAQGSVSLAPIVRDRAVSATLSVQSILTRIADSAWDVRSA